MVSSGLLRRVALVRTDVTEEPGASFIRVTKIGELGTTQAATSNRRTLRINNYHHPPGLTTQKTPFFKSKIDLGGNHEVTEYGQCLVPFTTKYVCSRLLSENVRITICKTMILTVVLYGVKLGL
jgi:hypothetical protein